MDNIVKPEQINIDNFVLHQIPLTNEYAQIIYDIFNEDIDGLKFWMNGKTFTSVENVLHSYKNNRQEDETWAFAMYGIFSGGELLGEIGLSGINKKNQTGEIGFWLKKSARGQKIIYKLLPEIEKLGFQNLNLRKISLWCDENNIATKTCAEHSGYIREGTLREEKLWPDSSVHSTAIFSKLKSEWH